MARNPLAEPLRIERLGQRGEGIGHAGPVAVYVPHAVPGDLVLAEIDQDRGRLVEVREPSPDRVPAICRYFTICGGCAVQTLAPAPYAAWKRDLLVGALRHVHMGDGGKDDIGARVAPLVDAHGEGRRRATFHARVVRDGLDRPTTHVGFMRARAHDLVDLDACPVLAPQMDDALPVARRLARALEHLNRPLDILVTATLEGLDVDLRGCGRLDEQVQQALVRLAGTLDLARLSNHGEIVIERRMPLLAMGAARVSPPPGVFLQATQAGEEALAALVVEAVGGAARIADLFSGIGTFALRLAGRAHVHAAESEAAAVAALARAANNTPGLRPVTVERRDLFRRPLRAGELARFDAVVLDPPRAGAQAQCEALAASAVARVVSVSCNVQTFARDARILADAGFRLERATPVDQFRHSPHVEMVGLFTRRPEKPGRRGRLLG